MNDPDRPTTLWARLTAARVPQLLGVYAGGSFAVLQVGDIFVDRLALPEWTFFGLALLLLVGIPLTVATALIQSAGRSLRLRGVFNWKNTALAGLGAVAALALAVGLFMGARALGIGPVGSLVAAGVLEREEAILIADFQSPTGDDLLAGAITEAFRIDFEQSPLVRVVAPGAVRDGLVRMQRPTDGSLTPELARELALREGIKAILMGEINRAGVGSIISVRLVAPDSEEAIVSFRETVADSSGVIAAVDRLSNRMRERIGESLRSIRGGESLERVSTSSLLALRLYSQGTRAIDRDREFDAGIALLEEALAEDPEFAMAWRKLGVALMNEGHDEERWKTAFTNAYELSDRLTERERYLTRAHYHSAVLDDEEGAMRAYRTLLQSYPNDGTALNNLAVLHVGRGERREAAELLRQALELESTTVIYYTNLLNQELALGELDRATSTLERFRTRFPDLPSVEQVEARLAWLGGEYEEAERRLMGVQDHPRSSTGERMNAGWGLVSLAALRGRVREAERRLDAVLELQRSLGMEVGPIAGVQYRISLQLHHLADTAGALQRVDELLTAHPIPDEAYIEGAHLQAAVLLAQAGAVERGRPYLEAWERITGGMDLPPYLARLEGNVRAFFTLQDGRVEEALDHHRRNLTSQLATTEDHFSVGEIHRQAGRPDSTIVHFEHALAMTTDDRTQFDPFLLPITLERLAEAYEEVGQPDRAREYYLRFAELWADADPELQPRVRAARERAEALAEN